MMKLQNSAIFLALISVLLWSTAGSAFKLSLDHIRPLEMLALANFTAVAALIWLTWRNKQLSLAFRANRQAWIRSALLGFLNPFLYYTILFPAYDRLLAQEALVLNYLWPVFLVLLSIPILKQRIAWYQIIGILIGFLGVAVVATEGKISGLHFNDPIGVAMAAGSAVVWALYWLLSMKDKRENLPKLLLNFCFGMLYTGIALCICGWKSSLSLPGVFGSIYIGLFEMGLTFAIWLKALTLAKDTARVSNLVFLSPVLSMVWIYIFVGEDILLSSLTGLALILLSIGLQRIRSGAK